MTYYPTERPRRQHSAATPSTLPVPPLPQWGPHPGFPSSAEGEGSGGVVDPFAALLRPDMFDAYPVDSSTFAPVAYANDGTATETAASSASASSQPRPAIPFLEDSLPQPSQGRYSVLS